jgi:DNA-binding CsgD family transcriptional regulator
MASPFGVNGVEHDRIRWKTRRLLSNREIGETLFISHTTAARHVADIFRKLGVDSRMKATANAR